MLRARVATPKALSVAFALALSLSLASCGDDDEGTVLRSGDHYVLVGDDTEGDNIAGVGYGGRVEIVGACFGIDGATVIWPHGTTIVSDDPLEIDVPGLGQIAEGDTVEGGADSRDLDNLPDGIDDLPSDCPSKDLFVFNVE